VFCTVPCWDSHVAMLRHRDAWAVEARAPSKEAWEKELAEHPPEPAPAPPASASPASPSSPAPVRRVVGEASPATAAALEGVSLQPAEREILIVISKLKNYIKERSGMNCSDAVAEHLSDHVRALCDEAIRSAARDGRKTVLDRDIRGRS
jgi:histone H3/H4